MNDIAAPKILYKYRSLNGCTGKFTESLLSSGEIYFSISEQLNDPFERYFLINNEEHVKLTLQEAETHKLVPWKDGIYKLTPQQYTQYMWQTSRKNEAYGILSLCERNDDILMHCHYADSFKGICIGFEWAEIGMEFAGSYPSQPNIPLKVNYEQKTLEFTDNPTPADWIKIFTTKPAVFSYEKEWRIFYLKGGLASSEMRARVRSSIKKIVLGHNISKGDVAKVKTLIHDLSGVELFITKPKADEYLLDIEPYNC